MKRQGSTDEDRGKDSSSGGPPVLDFSSALADANAATLAERRDRTVKTGSADGSREASAEGGERFAPGTLLAGRYRIVRTVGRGGMGKVYHADDLKLEVPVALKFLPEMLERDPAGLAQLLNEVRLARQIAHPNVCRMYDLGEVEIDRGSAHFISMEFIDGENLEALLRRLGRLPSDKALEVGRQICEGLAAVHEQGILHRDLKPSNLMIDSKGRARIADFGIAKPQTAAEDRTGIVGGTPPYMAPEQHAGAEATMASDLYALGLVLYELFTGERAFQARSWNEWVQVHKEVSPQPPSAWVENIEPAVEQLILRCLEKDPGERPSSATEVAEVLRRAQAGHPVFQEGSTLQTLVVIHLSSSEHDPASDPSGGPGSENDRWIRLLLEQFYGQRMGDEPGILLFGHPRQAIGFSLALHRALDELTQGREAGTTAGIGVHIGELRLRRRGAGARVQTLAFEIDDAAKAVAEGLAELAQERQTLVSQAAFDVARRSSASAEIARAEEVRWLAHGGYILDGVEGTVEVCEVGLERLSPLAAPEGSARAVRVLGQGKILGWRPAPGLAIPQRRHWAVERKLGEGGFGEVWLAVHQKTQAKRAFKFCYDSEKLKRLQREITLFRLMKETLGEREDIVRILDWNFDEAPFFIESEYTEYGSLLDWVDDRGGIDQIPLEQRLEIIAQVAAALAAAHSVGVLHKDIKPANILVSSDHEGRVQGRLGDFGIGTVTEHERLEAAGITALGLTAEVDTPDRSSFTGTRLYMAPEIFAGRPASLQADIYALGVILYQMVVGDFSRSLAPGWERAVGDELLLEDISAAVDGDPERRLQSAQRLSERLRSLEARRTELAAARRQQAERARSEEALRRSRRRSRLVATLLVAASALAAYTFYQSRRVELAAERARQEAQAARRIAGFMTDMFRLPDPSVSLGESITAQEILDQGARQIEGELADQPILKARLLQAMGVAYRNLGLYDPAISLLESSLRLKQDAAPSLGELEIVENLHDLSLAYRMRSNEGELDKAHEMALRSLEIRRRHLGEEHLEVAESLSAVGIVLYDKSNYDTAEPLLLEAYAMRRRLAGNESVLAAESLRDLGRLYQQKGAYEKAESSFERALSIYQLAGEDRSPRGISALSELGMLLHYKGERDRSREILRAALEVSQEVMGEEHPQTTSIMNSLATVLSANEEYYEVAESLFLDIIDMRKRRHGEGHFLVGSSQYSLSVIYAKWGDYSTAAELLADARKAFVETWGPRHHITGRAVRRTAWLEILQGNLETAEALSREALSIMMGTFPESHWDVALAKCVVGECLGKMGRFEEAEDILLECHAALAASDHTFINDSLTRLVELYENFGKEAEAAKYRQLLHDLEERG